MAYATSNPPELMAQAIAKHRQWRYSSVDAITLVRVAGYITNAAQLGMKAGDTVLVIDSDSSPLAQQWCTVNSINATTGAADLTDGTAITATNTD